jgi:hypothetical protein
LTDQPKYFSAENGANSAPELSLVLQKPTGDASRRRGVRLRKESPEF